MRLEGRTILVTGASRGIGQALVAELAARGAGCIVAAARDERRLAALADDHPGVVAPMVCRLDESAGIAALAERLQADHPALSVVINNAGVQRLTDLVDGGSARHVEALTAEIAVNLGGVVALTCLLLPQLLAQPDAMLVNVTSGLALAPKQSSPVYCATKAGLRSFTMALRYQAEARAPRLRVVEALPPLVDTDMTAGRGAGKISAEACAAEIVSGMVAGRTTINVGKTKLLRAVFGLSPSLAQRIMRDG